MNIREQFSEVVKALSRDELAELRGLIWAEESKFKPTIRLSTGQIVEWKDEYDGEHIGFSAEDQQDVTLPHVVEWMKDYRCCRLTRVDVEMITNVRDEFIDLMAIIEG